MYGKTGVDFPQRIVCLTAESAEIARAVGAGDRVVGGPGAVREPGDAEAKASDVLALAPDLVLAFSDRRVDVVRDLISAGAAVLCTNQRSVDGVLAAILLIGGALGCEERARDVIQDMRDEIKQVREYSSLWPDRPRVYFEEWFDPLTAGSRWVSELIEIAGGLDVFAELRGRRAASDRVVSPDEVVARDPEIILASWCGQPFEPARMAARPRWDTISAIRCGHVHEIDAADILVPGPSLTAGLRRIHEIIQARQSV